MHTIRGYDVDPVASFSIDLPPGFIVRHVQVVGGAPRMWIEFQRNVPGKPVTFFAAVDGNDINPNDEYCGTFVMNVPDPNRVLRDLVFHLYRKSS